MAVSKTGRGKCSLDRKSLHSKRGEDLRPGIVLWTAARERESPLQKGIFFWERRMFFGEGESSLEEEETAAREGKCPLEKESALLGRRLPRGKGECPLEKDSAL